MQITVKPEFMAFLSRLIAANPREPIDKQLDAYAALKEDTQ